MSDDTSNMPMGGGYDQVSDNAGSNQQGMGGGAGVQGSGVSGGYEGNQQAGGQAGGQKQDWLDKGIEGAGDKFGVNIVSALAGRVLGM